MSTDPGSAPPVLAVDGPGGSGKGTVSRVVADRLGWHLLDSGAIYRALALEAERSGVALDDEPALSGLAGGLDLCFEGGAGSGDTRVLLSGEEVSRALRDERCGEGASRVAALPLVRDALLARQRAYREPPGLVADGRDMGSTVFPGADLKVYLDASAEERARRRLNQLKEQGIDASLRKITADIVERDRRDMSRTVSPLRPAEDAVVIDTTDLSIEQVVARVIQALAARGFGGQ